MSEHLLHDLAGRLSTDGHRVGNSQHNGKRPQGPSKGASIHKLKPDESLLVKRPWRNSPKYFTKVLISTVALVKMSVHAKLGGSIEIMGMLTGKVVRDTFIVMDVYSLPVEGTETRVNAQNEAYEYMVQYLDSLREVGNTDSIVGWYHSHPGYGCWLSGIDVATQSLNQNFQDPYLAIVIDPIRSANQGKVDIGAFRTFPVGYDGDEGTTTSSRKNSKDLGAHSKDYYSLDVALFKGPRDEEVIDSILNTSWVSAFSRTTAATEQYDGSIAKKIEALASSCRRTTPRHESKIFSATMRMFDSIVTEHDDITVQRASSDAGVTTQSLDDPSIEPARKGRGLSRASLPYIDELEVDEGDSNREQTNDEEDEDDAADDVRSRITESEEPSNYVSEDDMSCDGDSINFPEPANEADSTYRADDNYSKGVKRNLHSSSEDSKLEVFFDHTSTGTRKRFAAGEDGGVVENDLKHKMQMLELELKQQHRELSAVAHAELMKVMANRASQRIFGRQK